MSEHDFPDNCWTQPRSYASAEVGDVFDGVPLSRLDDTFEIISLSPNEAAVPVIFALALVVGLYEGHVVLAPVTTKLNVSDQQAYEVLVESGRSAEKWARLPPCPGVFAEDALVSFFMPSTLPLVLLEHLQEARVAAMAETAQALLRRRFSRAQES